MTITLRTERLVLDDAGPADVDRSMLERDLALAELDPLRHSLVVRRHDGEVVGWADILDEHPRDGVPWIGLLELRADVHRQGLGREAAGALADWYAGRGVTRLRVGVDDGNASAAAFWRSLGYQPVDRRQRPSPQGTLGVDVLELQLPFVRRRASAVR